MQNCCFFLKSGFNILCTCENVDKNDIHVYVWVCTSMCNCSRICSPCTCVYICLNVQCIPECVHMHVCSYAYAWEVHLILIHFFQLKSVFKNIDYLKTFSFPHPLSPSCWHIHAILNCANSISLESCVLAQDQVVADQGEMLGLLGIVKSWFRYIWL